MWNPWSDMEDYNSNVENPSWIVQCGDGMKQAKSGSSYWPLCLILSSLILFHLHVSSYEPRLWLIICLAIICDQNLFFFHDFPCSIGYTLLLACKQVKDGVISSTEESGGEAVVGYISENASDSVNFSLYLNKAISCSSRRQIWLCLVKDFSPESCFPDVCIVLISSACDDQPPGGKSLNYYDLFFEPHNLCLNSYFWEGKMLNYTCMKYCENL